MNEQKRKSENIMWKKTIKTVAPSTNQSRCEGGDFFDSYVSELLLANWYVCSTYDPINNEQIPKTAAQNTKVVWLLTNFHETHTGNCESS